MMRFECAPLKVVQLSPHGHIRIHVNTLHLFGYMRMHIDCCNPTLFNIIEPLLVVAIVVKMKIQHVLQDEYEVRYTLLHQRVNNVRLKGHDIIFNGIVPFADEFQDTAPCVVIHK